MAFDHGKVQDFVPGAGLAAGVTQANYDDSAWLDIAIPGDVHRALIDAGRIPDPYYDRNEEACAWVEGREWWYRLPCPAPEGPLAEDERLQLVFTGLDTYATVWLDGRELGQHANMFRPATFDVTGLLEPGREHLLAICFAPLDQIAGKTLSAWGRNPERTAMRKAQFGFGWDWGPRLPTIGVWRPIELRRHRRTALAGVHCSTIDLTHNHDRAVVAVRVEAERFAGDDRPVATIRLAGPGGGPVIEQTLTLDGIGPALDATAYLTVDKPQLWWTHDLGTPARYDLSVTLGEPDHPDNRWSAPVGIRTLVLDQSPDPDERGTRFFRFVLNGVPIFARGADWIPCDSFVGAIPPARYTWLLEQARDANMTMLRVWGGGIYEHDHFYAECDRLGLLVWQDFMFACAMYPEDDPAFVAEVDAEARYQVRRLRSHPSLALWCGNNENQWLHDMRYWDTPEPPPFGALYYDRILPAAVADLDGRTPYWPGSPFGGDDHNSMAEGNRHNWDAWHGQFPRHFGGRPQREVTPENVSYLRYGEDLGRFISEFGLHAAPVAETLRRAIPPDQWYHHSPAMDWHNKDNPKDKGDLLLQTTTGLPHDLAEYFDFSQLAQAEGLKFGIEHYRRRKPHCSGTLVWQLDDCWPALSWSVIDYYGFGKAGYYYLRRVYSPVLASFKGLSDGGVELWITNDRLSPVEDIVTVRLGALTSDPAWEEQHTIAVRANTSQPVACWPASRFASPQEHYLAVQSAAGQFPANRHFFVALKDLRRTPAAPAMSIAQADAHTLHVTLTGQPHAYALLVHLLTSHETTAYSDNYIDLAPGEQRTIIVSDQARPLTPEALTLGWR